MSGRSVRQICVEASLILPARVRAIGYDLVGERVIRQRFFMPNYDREESVNDRP